MDKMIDGTEKMSDQTNAATIDNPATGETQLPDSPGKDENADGITGGQTTADVPGDVLGV